MALRRRKKGGNRGARVTRNKERKKEDEGKQEREGKEIRNLYRIVGFQNLGVPNFNGLLGLPVGNALFWVAPPELLQGREAKSVHFQQASRRPCSDGQRTTLGESLELRAEWMGPKE